jgi:hypothetical protein
MRDAWQGYPCKVGGHEAYVTYNHSAAQRLDELLFTTFAGFRVAFEAPGADGFPAESEHGRLRDLEIFLESQFRPEDGLMVGRTTTDGHRYFQFYTCLPLDACEDMARQASREFGYDVALAHDSEPGHTTYWSELYPNEDNWQVIRDRGLERHLQDAGDPLTEAREIQHWAWFGTAESRDAFVAAVPHLAEVVALDEAPEGDDRFRARLRHHGLPDHLSMHAVTIGLSRAARAHGGEYDGWETTVCRAME